VEWLAATRVVALIAFALTWLSHTIPERADQQANRARRGRQGGRPCGLDRDGYRHRNTVERDWKQTQALGRHCDPV
jgi:hypothetical protein